jgi:hypothetical protein
MDGGMKMQMSRMVPPSAGRMQACILWSRDSRRWALAGTTTLPCLVVTIIAPGIAGAAWAGALNMLAMAGGERISTFSTGAQSIEEQHSIGYQSCAAAGVATINSAARRHCLVIFTPVMSGCVAA